MKSGDVAWYAEWDMDGLVEWTGWVEMNDAPADNTSENIPGNAAAGTSVSKTAARSRAKTI